MPAIGQGNDGFFETCFVSICQPSGSEENFTALTETVDIDFGDKDFDPIALVNGGRISKWNPQGPMTITLEMYPLQAGTASGTTGFGVFHHFSGTTDAAQPLIFTNSRVRPAVRVSVLWTSSTAQTTAVAAVATGQKALRVMMADGYVTKATPSFTDGILKWTVEAKFAPFDQAGSANLQVASDDGAGGTGLTVAGAYTTSNKF